MGASRRCVVMESGVLPDSLPSLRICRAGIALRFILVPVELFRKFKKMGKVKVDMGEPILKASDVPTKVPANKDQSVVKSGLDVDGVTWNVTCVSMGNPRCVTFGTEGGQNLKVDELKLADIGPKFENHEVFPARTNTEFAQVFTPSHLKMRVWERGAGATLACGTGACAVVVAAAVLEGRAERNCTVDLPGGPLQIEGREENNHIYTTGPAEVVFYGSVPL